MKQVFYTGVDRIEVFTTIERCLMGLQEEQRAKVICVYSVVESKML